MSRSVLITYWALMAVCVAGFTLSLLHGLGVV